MDLKEFRQLTAHMPPETQIFFLDDWGNYQPATVLSLDDLEDDDDAAEDWPDNALVIAAEAT